MAELDNEKELENYLFSLVVEDDEEHPLDVRGKVFQQVELKGYGVMDLVYLSYCGESRIATIKITVVELKKGKIDLVAIAQISRYKQAINRFIESNQIETNKIIPIHVEVEGVLIGSGIASGDACFLADSIDWLRVYSYDLTLKNGLTFKCEYGWYNVAEDLSAIPIKKSIQESIVSAAKEVRYFRREHRKHKRRMLERDIIRNINLQEGSL